jgi:3',5'-cyclic AMP phosphodiesterase CpdA
MPSGALTVLHVSDFQCGTPFVPDAAEAMHRLASAMAPDIVVASGDLTQRAKKREFEQARRVLDGFGDVPRVVTPGNHDVPLYRSWERLTTPYRNWRRFTGRHELDSTTRVDGATLVALSSAAPRRAIVNGRIRSGQVDFARAAFDDAPATDLRVLVVHHHFVPVPEGDGGSPLPDAEELCRAFESMQVDVVLGGHVHQMHIRTSRDLATARRPSRTPPLPFVACGTTTSRRGRGPEVGRNSLCVLRFQGHEVTVTPFGRRIGGGDFQEKDPVTFSLCTRLEARGDAEGAAARASGDDGRDGSSASMGGEASPGSAGGP